MILAPGAKCTRTHCFANSERSYSESSASKGTEASSLWNRKRRHIISTSCTARVRAWNALDFPSPSAATAVADSYAARSTTRHAAPRSEVAATDADLGSSTSNACSPNTSPGSRIEGCASRPEAVERAPSTSSPSALAKTSPRAHGASSSTAADAPGLVKLFLPETYAWNVERTPYPTRSSRSATLGGRCARSFARASREETSSFEKSPLKLVAAPRSTKNISRRSSSSSPSRTIISPFLNVRTETPCASLPTCASVRLSKMGTRRRMSTLRLCRKSRSAPVSASRMANIKP
mmetsp:Transcript_10871/g.45649  ORF Transcript_10871/g.45649 Transcript_10871/m.45649 type:complete len:292 (+) Transcript_10871:654-1529(+)